MTMHQVPECPCPHCGNLQNVVENDYFHEPPKPGDIVVCCCCAASLIFIEDLTVRKLTAAEFLALPTEAKGELLMEMAFVITASPSKRIH